MKTFLSATHLKGEIVELPFKEYGYLMYYDSGTTKHQIFLVLS